MNLPNKLTVGRICLVPLLVLIWIFPYAQFGLSIPSIKIGGVTGVSLSVLNLVVLAIFAIASITDAVDGYLARKNNQITTFGKFADPIADKMLVNTVFIMLVARGTVPVVPVLLMVARDTIVDGCRLIAMSNGVVVAAGFLGKLKTVLQMVTIVMVLLNNLPFELYRIPMTDLLLWFTVFISLASGLSYFNQLKEYIFESK